MSDGKKINVVRIPTNTPLPVSQADKSEALGCCSTMAQEKCCAPSEKSSCCGDTASTGSCGCQ